MTPQEMLVGRTLQRGAYRVEAMLGYGGMGQVFLAAHTQAHVPVALKQVRADEPLPACVIEELDRLLQHRETSAPPTQGDFPLSGGSHTDRFLREALLMARLCHPAIPLLYDYFWEDGYWYLVMEYVPGPTLAHYTHEHLPLPQLEAINYALQLCDVLAYLHARNPPVIFRDLKPTNILLHPDGRLMLVDFGIARYYKEGQVSDTTDFGSPGYASPEQFEGTGQTDARSDLFSLGVLLHEMLSGQHPTRRKVVTGQLVALHTHNPGISPALGGLVMVATRIEPTERFQSAHTFAHALERVRAVEERRAYRYHALVATAQATPAGPPLIPPPHAQGLLSYDLVYEQEQRARQMRLRPQPPRNTPRPYLEQEAVAHQSRATHARLKLPTVSSAPTLRVPPSTTLPPINPDSNPVAIVPATAATTPQIPPALPATPRRPLTHTRRVSVFCILLLLVSGSVLALISLAPTQAQPQHKLTLHAIIVTQQRATPTVSVSAMWQSLPALPSVEADNTALYVHSQGQAFIYLTGGFRGSHMIPSYSQGLYRYVIASATWEKVNVAGFPTMGNNAAAVDEQGDLFFTGGYAPKLGTISANLYQYQPNDHTLRVIPVPAAFPLGFGGAMLADQHGHLYLSEGFLLPGQPAAQAGTGWYRYDIASGLWHSLSALPHGLGYVQLVQDNAGNILLLGGSSDAGQHQPAQQIYRYDVQRDVWTQLTTTLPAPLSGSASCADGLGHVVLVGGFDPVHKRTLATAYLLNLATLTWRALPPVPDGGSWLGTAVCDGHGHVYVTRGANNPTQPTSDFLELTLPQAG